MTRNMSSPDRIIRALVIAPAAVIAALLIGAGTVAGVVLLAVAAIMLGTAAAAWCPLYALLGINTCRRTGSVGPA
jgi:hypothetical protein